MTMLEEYDIFICYYETTAKDYASALYSALTGTRNYRVFVAHIKRDLMSGDFREDNIDPIIKKSKIFILINTLDALDRPEVTREVKIAFPNGEIKEHDFWVFRENKENVKYVTEHFRNETKISLEKINQNKFQNETELIRIALTKCDNKRAYVTKEISTKSPPIRLQSLTINMKPSTVFDPNQKIAELENYAKNKNYSAALNVCDELLSLDPFNSEIFNYKAILLSILGNHEESITNFELAISLNSTNPHFWNNKAITLTRRNKFDDAIICVDKALALQPKNIEFLKTKGFIYSENDDAVAALEIFENALKIKSDDSRSISSKAAMLNRLGKSDEAIKLLKHAIRLDKKNDNALYNMGVMAGESGNDQKALEYYEKALALKPFEPKSLNNKGSILRKQGRYDEALQLFEKAIEIQPNSPRHYHNAGLIYGLKELYTKSIDYFDQALNLDENFIPALMNKSVSLFRLGQKSEAISLVDKVIQNNPTDIIILNNAIVMYLEEKMGDKAEQVVENALEIEPKNTQIQELAYHTYCLQKKYGRSIEITNETLETSPKNIPALVNRSAAYIKMGEIQKAIQDCDMVLGIDNNIGVAYYNKACGFALSNEKNKALTFLEKAIEINKEYKELAKDEEDFVEIKEDEKFKEIIS